MHSRLCLKGQLLCACTLFVQFNLFLLALNCFLLYSKIKSCLHCHGTELLLLCHLFPWHLILLNPLTAPDLLVVLHAYFWATNLTDPVNGSMEVVDKCTGDRGHDEAMTVDVNENPRGREDGIVSSRGHILHLCNQEIHQSIFGRQESIWLYDYCSQYMC